MTRRAKMQPTGICDLCGGAIPRGEWYTSKGAPRLHCSLECKQTANSRAGNPKRIEKLKRAIARGEWQNPRALMTPAEISAAQAHASKTARLREVAAGQWRNPALDAKARKKLSRPRKHRGRLHRALEMLREGVKLRDLPEDLRQAHNRYRRRLAKKNAAPRRAWYRAWYQKRQTQMTPEAREQQRAKWRAANRRKAQAQRATRATAKRAPGVSSKARDRGKP